MPRTVSIWITGQPIEPARKGHGDFSDMIRRAIGPEVGVDYRLVDCEDERAPLPEPGEVDAVIVTGSPAHVQDELPWMHRAARALHALASSTTPVLGICFGHQLLGHAFGGGVAQNRKGRELGIVEANVLEDDEILGKAGRRLVVMAHFDSVQALPPAASLLATTVREDLAAIRYAPRVWGVQFHPEMNVAIARNYVEYYGGSWDGAAESAFAAQGDYAGEVLRRFVALGATG